MDYYNDVGPDRPLYAEVAITVKNELISMMNAQLPLQQREKITALQGKAVLVLGAGKTGTSIVRWLTCVGAVVILADSRARPPGIARLEAEFPDLIFQAGPFINLNYDDVDLVVTSPGVPLDAIPLEELKQKNISVVGDIEIFLCENRERFESKVLAITGTNGKSTVTRMVETILKVSGVDAIAVGNIGTPVLEILTQIVTGERKAPDVFVLEISSFQIDTTFTLDFHGAVILNISEDHLDRYENYEAYIKSKSRIYSGAGKKVLNRDDPLVMNSIPMSDDIVTFGLSQPDSDVAWGVGRIEEVEWLMLGDQKICRSDDLPVLGRHNVSNALAALALSALFVSSNEIAVNGLMKYSGLDHRMQMVADVNGVRFFNDSKATNVGATLAAISGLSEVAILILGGQSKQQNFETLTKVIRQKIRTVILIGKDTLIIKAAIEGAGVPVIEASNMADAVRLSADIAECDDLVLLSPACASFDMFDDYIHRGDVYMEAVRSLI